MQSILLLLTDKTFKTSIITVLILLFSCASFAQDSAKNGSVSLLKQGDTAPINTLKDTSDIEHKFPTENKWNLVFDTFIHYSAGQCSILDSLPYGAGTINLINGSHVVSMSMGYDFSGFHFNTQGCSEYI